MRIFWVLFFSLSMLRGMLFLHVGVCRKEEPLPSPGLSSLAIYWDKRLNTKWAEGSNQHSLRLGVFMEFTGHFKKDGEVKGGGKDSGGQRSGKWWRLWGKGWALWNSPLLILSSKDPPSINLGDRQQTLDSLQCFQKGSQGRLGSLSEK